MPLPLVHGAPTRPSPSPALPVGKEDGILAIYSLLSNSSVRSPTYRMNGCLVVEVVTNATEGIFSCSTEQPLEFLCDYPVAFARAGLQALPVEDGAFAPAIADQPMLLEGFKNLGDGGAPDA